MPSRVTCGRLQKESGLGVESFFLQIRDKDNQGGKSRQQVLTNYLQLPHHVASGLVLPSYLYYNYLPVRRLGERQQKN